MNKVLRQEKKYLLNLEEASKLKHLISEVMITDANGGPDGYSVRSLYFDTINDSDYQDKVDGLEIRRKIRLRIYDPSNDFAMLEMKQKQGSNQLKRSLKMTKEDAEALIKGDYDVLLKYPDDFAAECFGLMHMKGYRPKTIVEYKRRAFMAKENKIRITFDSEIKSTESSFDLFSENLPMYSVMDPFYTVLEVKYNGFLLSYIQDLINHADKTVTSVSKYVLARKTGYGVWI